MLNTFAIKWVIICDYYALTTEGKGVMSGVFAEGIGVPDVAPRFFQPMSIVFCVQPLAQKFSIIFQLNDPSGRRLVQLTGNVHTEESVDLHDRLLMPMSLPAMPMPEYGEYSVWVGTNEEEMFQVHTFHVAPIDVEN